MPLEVQRGVHGLANHLLDTPWPKVVKGRAGLERLTGSPFSIDDHLALLDDIVPADERDLPQVGVDIERERRLSSLRILSALWSAAIAPMAKSPVKCGTDSRSNKSPPRRRALRDALLHRGSDHLCGRDRLRERPMIPAA